MMMKKNLLLIATIAAAANTGYALAQSSVTLYGIVNAGVVNYGGDGTGTSSVTKLNSYGSRFGLTGSEDLGGGLSAIFTVESGFHADTGAADPDRKMMGRQATVGLQGGFGKIQFGRLANPLDDMTEIAGSGANAHGQIMSGFWGNGDAEVVGIGRNCSTTAAPNRDDGILVTDGFSFDGRYDNSIRYDSPDMNGFNVATHLGLGEKSSCRAYAWSTKLQYKKDGVNAALIYNQHNNIRQEGLKDHLIALTGGYSFGPAYFGAYYQTLKYSNDNVTDRADLRQDSFGLIGKYKFGSSEVELGWYRAGQGRGAAITGSGLGVGDGTQANLYALVYRYDLSKRTQLWSEIAQIRNGRGANYGFRDNDVPTLGGTRSAGESPRFIAAGIKHSF